MIFRPLAKSEAAVATTAPTLESVRVILRAARTDDLSASAAMWADPDVVRHISGTPSTREQTWSRLLRYAGHWALLGFGYWIVEERSTGAFVGEVGFADYKRDIDPPLAVPEIGWVIAPGAHGKGYATEATRAAIGWAERNLDAPALSCIITPDNAPSIRVAQKCGFTMLQQTAYHGDTVLVFTRAHSILRKQTTRSVSVNPKA